MQLYHIYAYLAYRLDYNHLNNRAIITNMIAHIQGKIAEKFAGSVIVDVSGVGYEIIVPETEYN